MCPRKIEASMNIMLQCMKQMLFPSQKTQHEFGKFVGKERVTCSSGSIMMVGN